MSSTTGLATRLVAFARARVRHPTGPRLFLSDRPQSHAVALPGDFRYLDHRIVGRELGLVFGDLGCVRAERRLEVFE